MSKNELHLQVFSAAHEHIGHFDGEFFYTKPQINLRVDGDEVYTLDTQPRFIGHFKGDHIELLNGSVPYYFKN